MTAPVEPLQAASSIVLVYGPVHSTVNLASLALDDVTPLSSRAPGFDSTTQLLSRSVYPGVDCGIDLKAGRRFGWADWRLRSLLIAIVVEGGRRSSVFRFEEQERSAGTAQASPLSQADTARCPSRLRGPSGFPFPSSAAQDVTICSSYSVRRTLLEPWNLRGLGSGRRATWTRNFGGDAPDCFDRPNSNGNGELDTGSYAPIAPSMRSISSTTQRAVAGYGVVELSHSARAIDAGRVRDSRARKG